MVMFCGCLTIDCQGRHWNGPLKAPADLEDRRTRGDVPSARIRGRRTLTWTWRSLLNAGGTGENSSPPYGPPEAWQRIKFNCVTIIYTIGS